MIALRITKKLLYSSGVQELRVDLDIARGECVTLFGESGAGKTTILRMLAGLMKPDSGSIVVDGQTWFDAERKINLPPQHRKLGFVFQDHALFPHMTVRQNLAFARRADQPADVLDALLVKMELDALQNQKPGTLSGGQKQRVALARALVQQPEILVLDEPLSGLDARMRSELLDYMQEIQQDQRLTTILVSHNPEEITKLSTLLFELKAGQVIRKENAAAFLPLSNQGIDFSFSGEIASIAQRGTGWWITVKSQQNHFSLEVRAQQAGQFKPGDKVTVSLEAGSPAIRKDL